MCVHHQLYFSSQNFVKSLNFETAPKNITSPFKEDFKYGFDKNNNIRVEVTDYTRDILLVNSPNKNNIMKNGLTKLSRFHILGKGSFGTVLRGICKGKRK